MSTANVDIDYDLINGIFTVLDGNVSYGGTSYPVYKSIPKTPATVYVWITEVMSDEDGTKDEFVYYGTVQVRVINEGLQRADKKLIQGISGVTRGLLKTTKGSVFSIGDRTLVVFKQGTSSTLVEIGDNGIIRMSKIDIYDFIVE